MEPWQIYGLVALVVALIAFAIWWLIFRHFATSAREGQRRRAGYSVWRYQGGAWVMIENQSKAGYVPGPAPIEPGQFEGDTVQVISVPQP